MLGSPARREHITHCFRQPLNSLATNRALIPSLPASPDPSASSLASSREQRAHVPRSRTIQILRVGRVLSVWPSSPPQSPCIVNKRVQQFPSVFVAVEVLCRIPNLRSRYRDSGHCHTPNVHLRAFASRMFCLWRPVQCRGFGCSLGRCRQPDLTFPSHRRQHSRRRHLQRTFRSHHRLRLASGIGLSFSFDHSRTAEFHPVPVLMTTNEDELSFELPGLSSVGFSWASGKAGVPVSSASCVSHDAVRLVSGHKELPVSRAITKFLNVSPVPAVGIVLALPLCSIPCSNIVLGVCL